MSNSFNKPAGRTGPFCRRTRREFLWEAGAGFTGLALTGLLSRRRLLRRAAAAETARTFANPLAPKPPHFAGQGQERHLPVHVRRAQPGRYLRLQAEAVRPRRQDHPGEDLRPRRPQERGPRRRAEVEVQAVRPVRQVGQRPVPAPGHLRRRHRLPPLDDGRLADPRLGHAADEHGQDPVAAARASARGSTTAWAASTRTCPASCVMLDPTGGPISGAKNWSSGYMPATYQGTIFRSAGDADPRSRAAPRA